MKNKIYYGILMNKKKIFDNVFAFVPQCFLTGIIEKESDGVYFIDELDYSYLTIENLEVGYGDDECVVGYVISQEDLLKQNPNETLKNAKTIYYDNIMEYTHIGVLNLSYEKMQIYKIDFNGFLEKSLAIKAPNNNTEETKEINTSNKEETKNKKEVQNEKPKEEKDNQIINVKEMKEFFDKKIIGQDEAKKDVISAIVMNNLSNDSTNRNNCLLVGPTGSGKTLIAETVSEYLNIPMVSIDVTQLSAPGYVGASIEDFLVRLINIANGNIELAQNGIVVLDEIDKKGSEKNSDISGKAVLNTLLPFLQGATYDLKINNSTIPFNTTNITKFATGAFTDIADGKKKNSKDKSYKNTYTGFNSTSKENIENEEDIKYEKFEFDDFVQYGNIPIELIGRFSTITQLTGHTILSLKNILTNSTISPLIAEKNKLEKQKIILKWTKGYLDEVANAAIKLKTGGRSLKNIVENSIKEARWELLTNDFYDTIILTEKTVADNKDCILMNKDGNSINFKDIKAKSLTKSKKL